MMLYMLPMSVSIMGSIAILTIQFIFEPVALRLKLIENQSSAVTANLHFDTHRRRYGYRIRRHPSIDPAIY